MLPDLPDTEFCFLFFIQTGLGFTALAWLTFKTFTYSFPSFNDNHIPCCVMIKDTIVTLGEKGSPRQMESFAYNLKDKFWGYSKRG